MASIDAGHITHNPEQRSTLRRALFAIPVIGWIARDLLEGAADNIYYLLAAFVSLVVVAVMTWGLPALAMTALAMVPVMFVVLILITVGK